jgi:glutamate synthase (ferredoxin)
METILLERPEERDLQEVKKMISRHATYTDSELAQQLLTHWEDATPKFVKVMPKDYKRMLNAIRQAEQEGLVGEEAIMAAFEANKNDAARISGN